MSYLAPPGDGWALLFLVERGLIADAVGPLLHGIEHVGSTALPGIWAKPILDVAAIARTFPSAAAIGTALEPTGYRYRCDIDDGTGAWHYFLKDGEPTVHLHVFAAGSPEYERHLLFRDYLLAFPAQAARYEAEKRRLAALFPEDRAAYTEAKTPIIRELEAAAARWRAVVPTTPHPR